MDQVIPSSSPVVTPVKLHSAKRRRIESIEEISEPFNPFDALADADSDGIPDSPGSIHSSDQCSYSSYFERKQRERDEKFGPETQLETRLDTRAETRLETHGFTGQPSTPSTAGKVLGLSAPNSPNSHQSLRAWSPGSPERLCSSYTSPINSYESPLLLHPHPALTSPSRSRSFSHTPRPRTHAYQIHSSQQELEDIALPVRQRSQKGQHPPGSLESSEDPGQDTLRYIRQYCTESVLYSLPVPE